MNPAVPQSFIDEAYENDEVSARSEFGALWRDDLQNFVSRAVLDAVVVQGRLELPPVTGVSYVAFADPSGGSSDSMTMAIAHMEFDVSVLDVVHERKPPFSPEEVVATFAQTLKAYHCSKVTGDRYGGEWPRERFRVHGIEYFPAAKAKSDIYREFLPNLNARKVELLDHPRLIGQFSGLTRHVGRSGKDSIDHGPGGHDDVCNAAAGALTLVATMHVQRIEPCGPIAIYAPYPSPGTIDYVRVEAFQR